MKKILLLVAVLSFFGGTDGWSQKGKKNVPSPEPKGPLVENLSAFKLRNIGPAFLSGRIADIAIHPTDYSTWYVATGSSGVWKTENAGTTWTPIFDREKTYSTGCITIDPNEPSTIWLGTGENVGGRHVAYGEGIYKSQDAGKSWTNVGLPNSEHISKIIVHPNNSEVVWVAAQGPLWSKGGDRGVYKTTDGGATWKKTLGDEEWVGATDLIIHPEHPNVLYAATWQRHRTVAAYMGGGPGTGLYKSTDGGETWSKLTNGLPKSNMGKIGLAISPQHPDVVYAAIELDRTTGGVFRSADGGASWKKMSNTVSGGTGPHYYQELYASPHQFDRLYLMDVRIQVSEDGGRTFNQLKESDKHSDNHALAFRPDDPNYLLVGTDAGIYESHDLADNWRYIKNLPLTQFYKVAVNNAEPFYHVFGGTQDNGSAGGPSATDERQGIRNAHWYKTLGADGHQSATDPEYNNIIYAETQQGGLHRIDLVTGEQVYIQPQPASDQGEGFERFNWDAPILVSPHKPSRIYFASHRVWKSEDRGDSWTPISGDLTRNEERLSLPIMGRTQSWDNAWDVNAMSNYNTITSLAESPLKEGVIYAGTDDGHLQVTKDGGANWTRITTREMGLPDRAFINDVKADLFEEGTVYVAADNHKEGDYSPYLMKSTDYGTTWSSIANNLPDRKLVWRMVQDFVKKDLLFAAVEDGIYVSLNGGDYWQKLAGAPTIAFRDLTIQKRENDLVGASFGRGFFILDDYSPLRYLDEELVSKPAALLPIKDAKWYVPKSVIGNTGADYYFAENPAFGATFTYHLAEGAAPTLMEERKSKERELNKANQDVPFPGWDALDAEKSEEAAEIYLLVEDENGKVINRVKGTYKKGVNRVNWDLSAINPSPVSALNSASNRRWGRRGMMVTPGTYQVSLVKVDQGKHTLLDGPQSFNVVPLRKGTLEGAGVEDIRVFSQKLVEAQIRWSQINNDMGIIRNHLAAYETALQRAQGKMSGTHLKLVEAQKAFNAIEREVNGSPAKNEIGERNNPGVSNHLSVAYRGLSTTYGPTASHQQSLVIASNLMDELERVLQPILTKILPELENELKEVGAPIILKN
jgi:photosystem II stability/assembly factor-like uncharacterized protein